VRKARILDAERHTSLARSRPSGAGYARDMSERRDERRDDWDDFDSRRSGAETPGQEEVARESRQTGGDAPAAGSIEEREAVARDEDEPFDEQET
jgi:hypothetical protein